MNPVRETLLLSPRMSIVEKADEISTAGAAGKVIAEHHRYQYRPTEYGPPAGLVHTPMTRRNE